MKQDLFAVAILAKLNAISDALADADTSAADEDRLWMQSSILMDFLASEGYELGRDFDDDGAGSFVALR